MMSIWGKTLIIISSTSILFCINNYNLQTKVSVPKSSYDLPEYYNIESYDQKQTPELQTEKDASSYQDDGFNVENLPEGDDYYSKETGEYYDENGNYLGLYNSKSGDYYDKTGTYVGRYNEVTGEYFSRTGAYVGRYDQNTGEYYDKNEQYIGRFDKVLNQYYDKKENLIKRDELNKKLKQVLN